MAETETRPLTPLNSRRDDADLDALVRESFGWTGLNFHQGFDEAIRLAKEARDERDRLNDQWSDTARLAAVANAENAALRARVEALGSEADLLLDRVNDIRDVAVGFCNPAHAANCDCEDKTIHKAPCGWFYVLAVGRCFDQVVEAIEAIEKAGGTAAQESAETPK